MTDSIFTDSQWERRLKQMDDTMLTNRANGSGRLYCFLDFDGVINVFHPPGTPGYEEMTKRIADEFQFVDPPSMKRFSNLAVDYELSLVISSSWRYSGMPYCYEYLRRGGLSHKVRFCGCTQIDYSSTREMLISEYLLAKDDYSGFIILDDMDMPMLKNYLIRTESLVGFSEEKDEEARKLLDMFRK